MTHAYAHKLYREKASSACATRSIHYREAFLAVGVAIVTATVTAPTVRQKRRINWRQPVGGRLVNA